MCMNHRVYYAGEASEALNYAVGELAMRGLEVADVPCDEVTHLLLGVPCRMNALQVEALLKKLPRQVKVFGGFLNREELKGYRCFDLLQDEPYLAKNAAITAHCAAEIAMQKLPVTMEGCPVLILGWGRIGKCLAQLLKAMGSEVTVAVRKPEQQAMIAALGYEAEELPLPEYILPRFRVIFNTVPSPVLSEQALKHCRFGCVKIELASAPGLEGPDILSARGLPGTMAPESSGKLIARTVLRLSANKEERL